jgi:hypothetical protein
MLPPSNEDKHKDGAKLDKSDYEMQFNELLAKALATAINVTLSTVGNDMYVFYPIKPRLNAALIGHEVGLKAINCVAIFAANEAVKAEQSTSRFERISSPSARLRLETLQKVSKQFAVTLSQIDPETRTKFLKKMNSLL